MMSRAAAAVTVEHLRDKYAVVGSFLRRGIPNAVPVPERELVGDLLTLLDAVDTLTAPAPDPSAAPEGDAGKEAARG